MSYQNRLPRLDTLTNTRRPLVLPDRLSRSSRGWTVPYIFYGTRNSPSNFMKPFWKVKEVMVDLLLSSLFWTSPPVSPHWLDPSGVNESGSVRVEETKRLLSDFRESSPTLKRSTGFYSSTSFVLLYPQTIGREVLFYRKRDYWLPVIFLFHLFGRSIIHFAWK